MIVEILISLGGSKIETLYFIVKYHWLDKNIGG